VWGNNAAWLCVNCRALLGNWTGAVAPTPREWGARYEILSRPNQYGRDNQGPAVGVRLLPSN
jgi:hypothetical protein